MALVTDKFRIYSAEELRNTLTATNKVYMFVGRPKTWGSSDVPPTGEPIDSFEYARTTYQIPLLLSVLIYLILHL